MARMLTEEEVREMEKQRELRDRARAAGSTAGMSWEERLQDREDKLNERFKKAHEEAMERKRLNVLANPGAEANTNYRHSVMRGEEMRLAREHEMGMLSKELKTREEEALQKRWGMEEQGEGAAKANRDAAIRTAEVQAANAEKIAGINKEIEGIKAKRDTEVETIRGKNNLEVAKEQGDTNVDVARIGKEGAVEAERVRAEAQERRLMAERLMQERRLDENSAVAITKAAQEMVRNSKNKQTGKPTMTYEEALEKVIKMRKSSGKSVGTPRPTSNWEY